MKLIFSLVFLTVFVSAAAFANEQEVKVYKMEVNPHAKAYTGQVFSHRLEVLVKVTTQPGVKAHARSHDAENCEYLNDDFNHPVNCTAVCRTTVDLNIGSYEMAVKDLETGAVIKSGTQNLIVNHQTEIPGECGFTMPPLTKLTAFTTWDKFVSASFKTNGDKGVSFSLSPVEVQLAEVSERVYAADVIRLPSKLNGFISYYELLAQWGVSTTIINGKVDSTRGF